MVLRLNLVSLVPVSGVTSIRAQVLRRFGRVCVAVTSFRVCYVVSGVLRENVNRFGPVSGYVVSGVLRRFGHTGGLVHFRSGAGFGPECSDCCLSRQLPPTSAL